MDPRPNLPTIVNCVEKAFELSEASNTPVMLELRIRACHVQGAFIGQGQHRAEPSRRAASSTTAAPHNYEQLAHPPVTYGQEKSKYDVRMPAARKFIAEHKLNEIFDGRHGDVGIIVQGGIYNSLIRALQQIGLADATGRDRLPLLVLNVVYPLVPDEITRFAAGANGAARRRGGAARISSSTRSARSCAAPTQCETRRQGRVADGGRIHLRNPAGRRRQVRAARMCRRSTISATRATPTRSR